MSYQCHNVTHVRQGSWVLRITAFPLYVTVQRGTGYCGKFVITDERMEFYWFEKCPAFAHLYDGLCWDYHVIEELFIQQTIKNSSSKENQHESAKALDDGKP